MALASGFLWFAVGEVAPVGNFRPWLKFHSTDNYLSALIGRDSGSEFLLHAFAALPAKAPIAVVYSEESNADTFLSYLVTYLAWPRAVRAVAVTSSTYASKLGKLDTTGLCAVIFCGVPPPPNTQNRVRLGENLVLVPRIAAPE
ncbi:MAG: hypothetical protein ABI992_07050 [Chthoniobacterales bacterium]